MVALIGFFGCVAVVLGHFGSWQAARPAEHKPQDLSIYLTEQDKAWFSNWDRIMENS